VRLCHRALEKRDGVEVAREDFLKSVDDCLLFAFNPIIAGVISAQLQIAQGGVGDGEAFDAGIFFN
jgi:hypothetical protein